VLHGSLAAKGLCYDLLPIHCRLLAFLREEEERERLEEVERLRPIGTAVGPYMEYRSAIGRNADTLLITSVVYVICALSRRQSYGLTVHTAAESQHSSQCAMPPLVDAFGQLLVCLMDLCINVALLHCCRCKAEPSQLLKTEFGDFTVDNRCWARTGFSLTQARAAGMTA